MRQLWLVEFVVGETVLLLVVYEAAQAGF